MPEDFSTRTAGSLTQSVRPTVGLHLESNSLQPLLKQIVNAVLQELNLDYTPLSHGKLAYNESEAAASLGLNSWQLRDLRRDGKITHRRIVGNRVRDTLEALSKYLDRSIQPDIQQRRSNRLRNELPQRRSV